MNASRSQQKSRISLSNSSPQHSAQSFDFDRKLRIVQDIQALSQLITQAHLVLPNTVNSEYLTLCGQFATSFPPLVQENRARKSVCPSSSSSTRSLRSTRQQQPPDTISSAQGSPPKPIPPVSVKPSLDIRLPSWRSAPPIQSLSSVSWTPDQLELRSDGFHVVGSDPSTSTPVPSKDIAEYLMCSVALNLPRRKNFSPQNLNCRRFTPDETTLTYKLFGIPGYTYAPTLEDFTFMVDFLIQKSTSIPPRIDFSTLQLLLRQSTEPRNRPELDANTFVISPDLIRHSTSKSAQISDGGPPPSHQSSSPSLPHYFHTIDTLYSMIHPGPSPDLDRRSDIPPVLRGLSQKAIIAYKKMMGPLLTDEVFLYLIDLFETLTEFKEIISFDLAYEEARVKLGPLCPVVATMTAVYEHWKLRRLKLRKPLARQYWAVPLGNDCSPFAVFRARTKEKMVLRRSRRSTVDSVQKIGRYHQGFVFTEALFVATQIRDWLKLILNDLDSVIFEQLWKTQFEPHYKHPLWTPLKSRLSQQLLEVKEINALLCSQTGVEMQPSPASIPVTSVVPSESGVFKALLNHEIGTKPPRKRRRIEDISLPETPSPLEHECSSLSSQFYLGRLPTIALIQRYDKEVHSPPTSSSLPLGPSASSSDCKSNVGATHSVYAGPSFVKRSPPLTPWLSSSPSLSSYRISLRMGRGRCRFWIDRYRKPSCSPCEDSEGSSGRSDPADCAVCLPYTTWNWTDDPENTGNYTVYSLPRQAMRRLQELRQLQFLNAYLPPA